MFAKETYLHNQSDKSVSSVYVLHLNNLTKAMDALRWTRLFLIFLSHIYFSFACIQIQLLLKHIQLSKWAKMQFIVKCHAI